MSAGQPQDPTPATASPQHHGDYDTRLAAYFAIVDDQQSLLLTWWNGEDQWQPRWTLPGWGGVRRDLRRGGRARDL